MDRIERVEDSASNGGSNNLRPPAQDAFPAFPEGTGSQQQPAARPTHRLRSRNRQPSIRLRRLSSTSSLGQQEAARSTEQFPQLTPQATTDERNSIPLTEQSQDDSWEASRRRSNSEPRPGRYSAPPIIVTSGIPMSQQHPMSPVREETGSIFRPSTDLNHAERLAALRNVSLNASGDDGIAPEETTASEQTLTPRPGMLRRASNAAFSAIGRNRASTVAGADPARHSVAADEYDSRIVDFLDVIGKLCCLVKAFRFVKLTTSSDPEISTLSTLTNVQNSLFVPDLGPLLNRMPTYTLTRRSSKAAGLDTTQRKPEPVVAEEPLQTIAERPAPVTSVTSALGTEPFAVLPDGVTLEGWTQEDIEELNDHVRHMLHSRRSKFKQAMKGFGQYVRRRTCDFILHCYDRVRTNCYLALGFLVTLYATLITLFGLAWVLFLIGM